MVTKVSIKGVIIGNDYKEFYDWFEMESTCPNDVSSLLPTDNSPVEVIINSNGGHVDAGSEIYTMLKEYKGNVTVKIVGIAASAASVIAMGGDRVLISPTAQIMIHNVSSSVHGDHRALQHESDVLKEYNRSIANAYIVKTGKSENELLDLMNKETYFSAQSALEHGLVDEIMFQNDTPQMVASTALMLPQSAIDKVRQLNVQMKNTSVNEQQLEKIVEMVTNKIMKTNESKQATHVVKSRFIF